MPEVGNAVVLKVWAYELVLRSKEDSVVDVVNITAGSNVRSPNLVPVGSVPIIPFAEVCVD
jgi:hypothetical protein